LSLLRLILFSFLFFAQSKLVPDISHKNHSFHVHDAKKREEKERKSSKGIFEGGKESFFVLTFLSVFSYHK
jgi:hypothetical protein